MEYLGLAENEERTTVCGFSISEARLTAAAVSLLGSAILPACPNSQL